MYKKPSYILCLIFPFVLLSNIPDWVESHPISNTYFIGIGVVEKDEYDNYAQVARNRALSDLASEISVSISSELTDVVIEASGMTEVETSFEIHTSTVADLEGYEIVDSWENGDEYWVYCRLSKFLYKEQELLRQENAVRLSTDFFLRARELEKAQVDYIANVTMVLQYYTQALHALQNYIAIPIEATIQDEDIILQNAVITSMQDIMDNIRLEPSNSDLDFDVSSNVNELITIHASYWDNGIEIPLTDLPLVFEFIEGGGEFRERIHTNSDGVAEMQLLSISHTSAVHLIRCSLDIASYISADNISSLLLTILENISVPSTEIFIKVQRPSLFLSSDERISQEPVASKMLEPAFRSAFSNMGFSFAVNAHQADIIIEIIADSRNGSEMYNRYTAYVDVWITVTNTTSGSEIYSTTLQNIKGIQLDYHNATLDAYEEAVSEMVDIALDIQEAL